MKKRDTNSEVPANFNDLINMWSLESIACITLNTRLGLLTENNKDEKGEELIKVCKNLNFIRHELQR